MQLTGRRATHLAQEQGEIHILDGGAEGSLGKRSGRGENRVGRLEGERHVVQRAAQIFGGRRAGNAFPRPLRRFLRALIPQRRRQGGRAP